MKVLQICNDFNYQKLYINLFRENSKNIDQIIYCGARSKELQGANIDESISNIQYLNPLILRKTDRFNYFGKAIRQFRYINSKIDSKEINHIHSHTLFSDGILSYLLSKKYKIPFTVSVRNTDVNLFFKYKPYLIPLARKICNAASIIHFPSVTVKKKFDDKILIMEEKMKVIPNPIDDFWFNSRKKNRKIYNKSDSFTICYVGKIDKNKNLQALLNSYSEIQNDLDVKLLIVGENKLNSVRKRILEMKDVIRINFISSKVELARIYEESHLLCLPSKKETFGLVCIEALSQGIPFLMRKGQGIDGLLSVSEKMFFTNDNQLTNRILEIIRDYNSLNDVKIDFNQFKLSKISSGMISIYKE